MAPAVRIAARTGGGTGHLAAAFDRYAGQLGPGTRRALEHAGRT